MSNIGLIQPAVLPKSLTSLTIENEKFDLPSEPHLGDLFPNLLKLHLSGLSFQAWDALLTLPPLLESLIIKWQPGVSASSPFALPSAFPASLTVMDLDNKVISVLSRFWTSLINLQVLKLVCSIESLDIFADFPFNLEELALRFDQVIEPKTEP